MFKNHKKIIIGSRASPLAKKQVEIFKKESLKINNKLNFETKLINTTADKIVDKKLNELGWKLRYADEDEFNGEIFWNYEKQIDGDFVGLDVFIGE